MENPQALVATNWKPKPWVAIVLSIFALPYSMLYLAKPRLALYYFLAALSIAIGEFWLLSNGAPSWLKYVSVGWLLNIACAIHSYKLAKNETFLLPRVWYSSWYGLLAIFIAPLLVFFLERSFFYEPFRTPSSSMAPTLPAGSLVIVNKLGFGHYGTYGVRIMTMPLSAKIERGDIMVFQSPPDPKTDYVKRIIGLPGDGISYKSKTLYINGIEAKTTPLHETIEGTIIEERYEGKSWQALNNSDRPPRDFEDKVPEHQYFVLGDNRDNSGDSRHFGFVPEENMVGKVVYVIK